MIHQGQVYWFTPRGVVNVSQLRASLTDKIGSLGTERMRQVLSGIALVFGLDDPELYSGS